MAVDVSIRGADDFYKLSKALKHAGEKDLRKELHSAMRKAATPMVKVARGAALTSGIPETGGLAARIAKSRFRTVVRTGATTAGVSVSAPGNHVTAKLLNVYGIIRHPVYADGGLSRREQRWVQQSAPQAIGWFDRAMREHAPEVRGDLVKAMERVAQRVTKGS